jgi:hypothetical protein
MTFESQFLAVVPGRSTIGENRRAIASSDFDSVVASVNSGLKIESGAPQ